MIDVGLLIGLIAFVFYQCSNLTGRQINEIYMRRKSWLPSWIFGFIWIFLYVFIVVAGYYSFTADQTVIYFLPQLILFVINIFLNKLWSRVFFDGQYEADIEEQNTAIRRALYIIILMNVTGIIVLVCMGLMQQWLSFGLYSPYVLWVAIATILNINWIFSPLKKKDVLPIYRHCIMPPRLPKRTLLKTI